MKCKCYSRSFPKPLKRNDSLLNGNAIIGDIGANPALTHTDAQLTLGGTHNTGYNNNNQIKLLITGGNNDGGSPYYIMCEDKNGHDNSM